MPSLPSIEMKEHKGEENKLYNIKIFQWEKSIIFQIKKINDISELIYEEECTLKELYNKNNFFRCYSSIKDIFKEFFKEFKDKEIIISENDDKINLKFKFIILGKIQIIEFDINNYILNNTKILLKLCHQMIEINNINNELKKQIENNKKDTDEKIKENIRKGIIVILIVFIVMLLPYLKITKSKNNDIENNKLKSIKDKINDIENNKLKSITDKINDIEYIILKFIVNKINDIKNNKLKSITDKINDIENNKLNFIAKKIALASPSLKIFNNFFDIKIFISLMNKGINKYFNINIKNFELLYQASIDGFGAIKFHKKCDGKKNTIVLVITDNNRIFGGFSELEWDSYSLYKKGKKGFIFSINDNKIYYNKSKYKICCNENLEPIFEGGFSIKHIYPIHPIQELDFSGSSILGQDLKFEQDLKFGQELTCYRNVFDIEEQCNYPLAGEFEFKIKDYAVFLIYLEE